MQVEREATSVVDSGERASNAYLTCPRVGDSSGKPLVIPDDNGIPHGRPFKDLSLRDRDMSYQLVGEVTAHQGEDG